MNHGKNLLHLSLSLVHVCTVTNPTIHPAYSLQADGAVIPWLCWMVVMGAFGAFLFGFGTGKQAVAFAFLARACVAELAGTSPRPLLWCCLPTSYIRRTFLYRRRFKRRGQRLRHKVRASAGPPHRISLSTLIACCLQGSLRSFRLHAAG